MSTTEIQNLRDRTRSFALTIIRLYTRLPPGPEIHVIGRQLLRSGTSVGAHYREACRARSTAEFISKMEGALQELDETMYWLELLSQSGLYRNENIDALICESDELIRILVTCVKNAKEQENRS